MSREEWTVHERRFVVELREPVPDVRVADVAATVAGRFGMDPGRVHKLLSGRTGPVTKPVLEAKADLIARAFSEAGVSVAVFLAEDEDGGRSDSFEDGGYGPLALENGATGASEMPADASPSSVGDDRQPTPSTMFLSSTRWVPSPHESADPGDLASDGDTRPQAFEVATPPRSRVAALRPPKGGTNLRIYLLVGFVASLALLVVLQAVNSIAAGSASTRETMAAGMQAYSSGDFSAASKVWTPLARAGDARAQYMLGYMAENGQGRPWSNHDAATWYRLAANQSYPQAQVELGKLYVRGMGVPRDPALGAKLFRQAAEEGYGPGQFQYALALFQGSGVAQDFSAALRWFRAAAGNGVAEAQPYVAYAGSEVGGQAAGAPTATP